MIHPFRLWCSAPALNEARTARELAEFARRAEGLGFDGLVMPDHLLDGHSPLPLLASIAASTDRLRLVTFVLNNDLRRPGVLAHELTSLDLLSDGRIIAGLGAGWNQPEYAAAGLEYDPAAQRIARLEATVGTLRAAWSGEPPFDAYPKPVQDPVPILIGGGGKRLLSMAARTAQIVGLAPRVGTGGAADFRSLTAGAADEKLAWILEAAGERFESFEVNTYAAIRGGMRITDQPRTAAETIAAAVAERGGELTADEVLESPHTLLGSVDAIVDKCREMRQRWRTNIVMVGSDVDGFAPVVARLN